MGRVVSGFVHEFDNLLGVVRGHAELISNHPGVGDEIRKHSIQIVGHAGRASGLTRQLTAFGRRQECDARPFELNQAIKESLPSVRRVLPDQCLIELELGLGQPQLFGDPLVLEQVLLSLALHARHELEQGGTLIVQTRFVSDADSGQADWIELFLGTISSSHPKRAVLSEFWSTHEDGARTLSQGDPGLELADQLVSLVQGVVLVNETPGRHVVFRLRLPLTSRSDAPPSGWVLQEDPPATAGSQTILLVEDEEMVLSVQAHGLRRHGYHVLTARTAGEALRIWEAQGDSIDLLLSDIILKGGMHGTALAELLQRSRPELPVLFITGYPGETLSREFGIQDDGKVLRKPTDLTEVVAYVRRRLGAPG